jgi:hypothetical protein
MNMTKIWILFSLFVLPIPAFGGGHFCFKDMDNTVYEFSGGRLGKKAYAVRVSNVFCAGTPLPGIATFAKSKNGYLVTILVPRQIDNPFCDAFLVSGILDPDVTTITGNIDYLPRNAVPNEPIIASRLMCAPGGFEK